MVILQLKQCERALADGRFDEACELLRRPDVRAHRRGQELTSELVAAMVHRGTEHLAKGRLTEAAADAGKAVQLGGNIPTAAALRDAVANAQRNSDRLNQRAGQALALARRFLDQGQLTVGQQILADSPLNDPRIEDLRQDLTARRAALDSCLKKATLSFESGDWETAIDHLASSGKSALQDASVRRLADRIADQVTKLAAAQIDSGELNTAAALLMKLEYLSIQPAAIQRLHVALDQCRFISAAIEKAFASDTVESLLRLQTMLPNAGWIAKLLEHARQWSDAITALRSSPVTLVNPAAARTPPVASSALGLPRRDTLVLHVDGIGSYQVLTESGITIGPCGSSRKLDLALMVDSSAPTIKLSRNDEDYFLTADKPVMVNESPRSSGLLRDGDRFGLGPRCRLTFRRPSVASGTALLDISGARLPSAGVRQVILMDREIVIGPGSAVHIRADQLPASAVLIRLEDGSGFRSTGDAEIDGKTVGRGAALPFGVPISIGSLRFVISRENKP